MGWDGAGVRGTGMDRVGGASGRCGKERENTMEAGGGGGGAGDQKGRKGGTGEQVLS